jgi:hypothetical protein
MIQIFDGLVPEDEVKGIHNLMMHPGFAYYRAEEKYDISELDPRIKDTSGFGEFEYFCHVIVKYGNAVSNASELSDKILSYIKDKVKYKTVLTSRVNYNLPGKPIYGTAHVDLLNPHLVVIYYVNDSDGKTIIYNDELEIVQEIETVAGRFVVFDGNTLHGILCPQETHRIVFNFNLEL